MIRYYFSLLLLLASAMAAACERDTPALAAPVDPLSQQVHDLLFARRFAELDAMVVTLRAKDSLPSSTIFTVRKYYDGLALKFSRCTSKPREGWELEYGLLEEWRKAAPKSAPARIALANYQRQLAWTIRGNEFASAVTDEQWKGFREGMAKTEALLDTIASERDRDVAWYSSMIKVALERGWERKRFEQLTSRAFKRYPRSVSLHFDAAPYYTASWHGSQEMFDAFVEDSVRNAEAKFGQKLYMQLHYAYRDKNMYSSGRVDWARMKAGFRLYEQEAPDAKLHNQFAAAACTSKDMAVLKEQFEFIKDQIDLSVWGTKDWAQYCQHIPNGPVSCFRREDTKEKYCEPAKPAA